MNTAAIKSDLLKKIEAMSASQLKELYGIFENYFRSHDDMEAWDELTIAQQNEIDKSIKEGDDGKVTPVNEVISHLRKKYGLNG